jgi:polysaccharide lyase-like protein
MPRFVSPPSRLTGAFPLWVALLSLACSSSSGDDPSTAGRGGVSAGGTGGAGTAGSSIGVGGTTDPSLGGSGGSAGAAGSAGSAGSAAALGALCPEGSLFCDDFEDDTVGTIGAPWRASTNQATVAVDEAQAFSGTKAVHVNAPQAGTYHRGYFALDQGSSAGIFPAVAQEMYGRTMVYLGVLPNADAHWTFIQGEGPSADATHNALYRYGGQHQNGAQLMANYETTNGVATDCWDHSATLMPVAEWACVEWHFTVATNDMQLWLNGTELSDIHVTQQGEGCGGDALAQQWIAPPAFQTLYLGWEHYQQAANPIDVWMDDVVVDTKRVGCPAP